LFGCEYANAMDKNAIVVTKENKETALNSKRIRIPNVCENMGIKWINDFQFIERLDIKFSCSLT
jgi:NAD(P)H-nitrite reductase large subunit